MNGDGDDYDPPVRRRTPGNPRDLRSQQGVDTSRPLLGTPYVLEDAVGKGGMSQVYRGLHVELDRPVAIKLLNPNLVDHPEALSRLRREARILARLGNPNIVHVYDLGVSDDGLPFIAMQLLEGVDLRTVLADRGRLGFTETVRIAMQVASALQAVHEAGLVHRDLKPENVLLEQRASGVHVTVLDFGIAHIREGTETKLTVEGQLVGTPGYIAPELLVPGSTPNAFADQYSLGVLVYEMLTGRTPHEGDSVLQILNAQNANPPDPIGPHLEPGAVSKRAQWAVMKTLSRHPQNRFTDIAEFMEVLQYDKETTSLSGRRKKPMKRRTLVLLAALIGGLIGGVSSITNREKPKTQVTTSDMAPLPLGNLKIGWGPRRGRFQVYPFAVSSSMVAMELIVEPLIETTQGGQFAPRAAARWKIAADGRSVLVELRKGAKFSAHPCFPGGQSREANTKDLSYSIALRNKTPGEFNPGFGPTEILDRYRARVTFLRPTPFPEALLSTVFLVPSELDTACEDATNLAKPVGTGPFRLAPAMPGSYIRLERNPDYWQTGVPRLDQIDIFSVPDEASAVAGVLQGRLDVANIHRDSDKFLDDRTAKQPKLKSAYQKDGLSAYSRIDPNVVNRYGIMFMGTGPHSIPKYRRAIAMGLNRAALIADSDVKMDSWDRFLGSRFLGFDHQAKGYGFDLAEAKRLMKEVKAEHPALEPLVLGALPGRRGAKAVVAQLESIGVPHRLIIVPRDNLSEVIEAGTIDALLASEVLDCFGSDPLPLLLHDQSIGGPDPKLTQLRSDAGTELDRKRRAELYGKIERRLIELVPYIPIGFKLAELPVEHIIVGPRVDRMVDPITKTLDPLIISIFSRVGLTDTARRGL